MTMFSLNTGFSRNVLGVGTVYRSRPDGRVLLFAIIFYFYKMKKIPMVHRYSVLKERDGSIIRSLLYLIYFIGRKTRAGVKPCAAQEPLIESIKTLNGLAEGLHAEAKSIRGEISELYDRFDDPNVTDRDCEKRKQLLELSKYVKILEYRLQQAQRIDQLKVESEQNARLEDELNRIRKRAESDQKENRELYLQIISLRTSERALKDENRRLNNRLDQLSLHGTQVNEPKANNLDEEVQKETNLLQAEISVMRDSLSEVTKLNSDLKEKLILYQLKYGESDGYSTDRDMSYHLTEKTHETQVLAQKVNQLEQDKADLHQKLECIQNSDTEFLEEEMLILVRSSTNLTYISYIRFSNQQLKNLKLKIVD